MDQFEKKHPTELDTTLEKLLLKSLALLGLNEVERSKDSADAAEKQITQSTSPELKGLIYAQQLKLKTLNCAELQSKSGLDEGQAKGLADRRGSCLLEAVLIYHKILLTESPEALLVANKEMKSAFDQFSRFCKNPPKPKPLPRDSSENPEKADRTPEELLAYRKELTDQLLTQYRSTASQALSLLQTWIPQVPQKIGKLTLDLTSRLSPRNL